MNRKGVLFKQADISRAVKGVKLSGIEVGRVEIDRDGKIIVIAATKDASPTNDLDKWLNKNARAT